MAEFPGGQQIGGVAQGGVQPDYYVDAAGNQFWAMQTKLGKTIYQYVIYKQVPSGAISIAWLHIGGQGNLCLQPDGRLVAVAFAGPGEGQPIHAKTVPGWVVRA